MVKGKTKGSETEVRVRISGKRHGKIMALKTLLLDRSLIPQAIRTCIVYYSVFGKFPVIGAVSSRLIEEAERENDSYDTRIVFPKDAKVQELIEMLSLNGRIGMQLLLFTENCIDVCEEGEEWGCDSKTLQSIMCVGFKQKNFSEEEVQKIVLNASNIKRGSSPEKKVEQSSAAVPVEHKEESSETENEELIGLGEDSEFISIFLESDKFDLKGFKQYVSKISDFTPELLRDWVAHIQTSELDDKEKRIKMVRVYAANSGTEAGW